MNWGVMVFILIFGVGWGFSGEGGVVGGFCGFIGGGVGFFG